MKGGPGWVKIFSRISVITLVWFDLELPITQVGRSIFLEVATPTAQGDVNQTSPISRLHVGLKSVTGLMRRYDLICNCKLVQASKHKCTSSQISSHLCHCSMNWFSFSRHY